jgi:hypothetical protein
VAEAVELALDSGVIPRSGACFEAAARIAVDDGRLDAAACMWGAADRIAAEFGVVQTPLRRRLRARYEAKVRESLGEAGLHTEQKRGEELGLTEALETAAAIAGGSEVAPVPA